MTEPLTTSDDDSSAASTPESLRSSTVRSALWTATQNIGVRLLSLITFVILARLLTPYDYGVAAVAVAFSGFVSVLSSGGFSQSLVQKRDIDDSDVDSIFWFSLLLGVSLTLLFALASAPIASAFRMPELRLVLLALCPVFLAISLAQAHTGLLQRSFEFGSLARITLTGNLIATTVGVSLAFAGGGYWALVVQTAIVPVTTSLGVWRACGYRPGLRVSRARMAGVLRVSRHFVGVNLLTLVGQQGDKLVVGRSLGTAPLGVYAVAHRTVFIMLEVLSRSLQMVAFPAFARLQADRERLRSSAISGTRLAAAIAFPCFAFVAVAAPEIVGTVFGAKWLGCVPALRVFCLYGAIETISQFFTALLQGIGRAAAVLRVAILGTLLQVLALMVGVGYGLTLVAGAFVLRAAVTGPTLVTLACRELGRRALRDVLGAILPPVAATAALAATALAVLRVGWPSEAVGVFVSLVAAGSCYTLVLALVGRRHLRDLLELLGALRESRTRREE